MWSGQQKFYTQKPAETKFKIHGKYEVWSGFQAEFSRHLRSQFNFHILL